MATEGPVTFASLLRELRTGAGKSQRELAEAAGLSFRTISDLERGVATSPQKDTVRLLADQLGLIGPARAQFEAAARGRDETRGVAAATRTLPRDIASFTGRRRELDQLTEAAASAGGAVGIHAIGGMAGVGKTAFAVHAAHRLAERFPDGQIFLPLHGHTPGQKPVDPEDALCSLLLILGVAPGQMPLGLTARVALWRDRVAGQRLLLILDDAVSSEQIDPLLPGSGDSVVLITSRRHLSALDDATTISLDTLPAKEAAELLVRLTGRPGLGPDDPAVGRLTRLCGFLPLAVGMVARQLHHHPAWSLARRAAELASARDRLELMSTENLSVAAVFDLSYDDLDPDLQRLFRRLGLHPGGEFDAYAAAALDDTDLTAAALGLAALYDHYLLTEPAEGRYRPHDLIREHSRLLAASRDTDHDVAMARMLDYYQHTAYAANAVISFHTVPGPPLGPGANAAVPDVADSGHALAWLRGERATLLACLDQVTAAGQHTRITGITAGLAGLLRLDGPWTEAVRLHKAAVAAAEHAGNRLGEANALVDLGNAQRLTGNHPAAAQLLERALCLYRELGDRLGEANALSEIGLVRYYRDDYPGAARAAEEALGLYRDAGDRLGQANALRNLGVVRYSTSDYRGAARSYERALAIYRDLGHRQGQASALNQLGVVRGITADYPGAVLAEQEALVIFRDLGNPLGQASALGQLGVMHEETGDYPAAVRSLQEALQLYQECGSKIGEAVTLNALGSVRAVLGDFLAAARLQEQALVIYREVGNRLGEANAIYRLGIVRRLTGDYPAAARLQEQALVIFRDIGNRLGEGWSLVELGALHRLGGDLPVATRHTEQALAIYRELGDRLCEAQALNEAGAQRRLGGDLEQARRDHQQALDIAGAIGAQLEEAYALAGLGRCALTAGDCARARTLLRQALDTFERLGADDEAEVRAELDAVEDTCP